MKLVKCDACGTIVRENEASTFKFKEGSCGEILYEFNEEGYVNVDQAEIDVCRKCAIKVLSILQPRRNFLPLEEYKDN